MALAILASISLSCLSQIQKSSRSLILYLITSLILDCSRFLLIKTLPFIKVRIVLSDKNKKKSQFSPTLPFGLPYKVPPVHCVDRFKQLISLTLGGHNFDLSVEMLVVRINITRQTASLADLELQTISTKKFAKVNNLLCINLKNQLSLQHSFMSSCKFSIY